MKGREDMPEVRKSTPQNHSQLGASRFSFLLLLAFTAAVVYLVWAFVPAYMGNQRMEEAATAIVHRAATQNLDVKDAEAQLYEKAREFGLPESPGIKVWREGKGMKADITYTRLVSFPFYTYEWPVKIQVKDLGF
jgi:hypothetical protein